MDNTLYIQVFNVTFNKQSDFKTKIRPLKGDVLPINYLNEVVDRVVFVTEKIVEDRPCLRGYDLLVYTE